MELEIITENLSFMEEKFKNYLNFHLKSSMNTNINFIKYGFNSRKFNFFIFYDKTKVNSYNYNNHSIYYGVLEKEDYYIYFFGMDTDIQFNNRIIPRIAISLNIHDLDNSGILFGRDVEGKEYLLMKIKFNSLGKHQKAVLNAYNDIPKINNEFYINLGCFDNHVEILRNLRNFISKIKVDQSETNCLFLNSIRIPKDYIQLIGLPEDYNEDYINLNKNSYCMYCGHKIDITYELNKNLKNFAGENPDKCAFCFSKVLISYFQSKIDGKFKDKLELQYLSENNDLINFYIELSETTGIIGRNNDLKFNMDLSDFNKFHDEIPDNLIFEGSIMSNNKKKQKSKLKKRKEIDKLTRKSSGRSYNNFERLLNQYQLSYQDGQKIRQMLLDDLNNNKMNGKVNDEIKKYVIELSSKNKNTNLFKLSDKLNKLTLKENNVLNDDYIKKLENYSLTEQEGWAIRNDIIEKINNRIIVHPNTVKKKLNDLIEQYGVPKLNVDEINNCPASDINEFGYELSQPDFDDASNIKEFLLIDDYCHLIYNSIDNKQINMVKSMVDKNLVSLENLSISKISEKMYKVSIYFKILKDAISIKEVLIQNNFKELIIM